MTRRIATTVVLLAAGLAIWSVPSRVAALGDEVAGAMGQMMAYVAPPAGPEGRMDFIECTGCNGRPSTAGLAYGMSALLLAGGPLAFAAALLERRQNRSGGASMPAWWCRTGFLLQGASLAVGSLLVYALVEFAVTTGGVVHWSSAPGFADIIFGIPALFTWRRLQAGACAAPARRYLEAA
ncbi:MAG TPA: hypothetical protein VMW48_19210 [Vicinamibacterales bacterium]|nr:hypothetical protein [Vicinamibacterales bacterium]